VEEQAIAGESAIRDTYGRIVTVERISDDRIALTREHSATASEFWTLPAGEAARLAEEILRLTGDVC
jgi:hypothetical protein